MVFSRPNFRYVYNQLTSIKRQQTRVHSAPSATETFWALTGGQLLTDDVGERRLRLGGGMLRAVAVRAARPVPVRGAAAEGGAASPLRGSDAQHGLELQRSLEGSARHFLTPYGNCLKTLSARRTGFRGAEPQIAG